MNLDRRTILIIAVLLIAAVAAITVKNKLTKVQSAAPAVEGNRVLVAKKDLVAGSFVDSAVDVEWADMGKQPPEADVIREGKVKKSEYSGAVVRRAVKKGKAIAPDEITKAGDGGFLSAVLEPGMRAVSVAVNATTGAAGFIAPGDRVDLIVTHRIKSSRSESGSKQDMVASETFVENVRVVAVDQSLNTPSNKAVLAKNVTVEVNETQAERITVADEMGKISLSLRSALPSGEAKRTGGNTFTTDGDISGMLGAKGAINPRVKVIRGNEKENMQFNGEGAE